MRKTDLQKKERVKLALYELVKEDGIANLSIAKLARRANVSARTPYIYYVNKEDMLSQNYLDVKALLDKGLATDIEKGKTLQEKLFNAMYHFAVKFIEYPLETNYMFAMQNNMELLNDVAVREVQSIAKPLTNLYNEAIASGKIRTDVKDYVSGLLFGPMLWYLLHRGKEVTDSQELKKIISLSVDGIMKSL